MDILIESTRKFEKDLDRLSEEDRAAVVEKINACASLFPARATEGYRQLHHSMLPLDFSDHESSLYTLKLAHGMRAILSVDEDPIFDQFIFTLFRVVDDDQLERAYKGVAETLYQDLLQKSLEPVQAL